MMFPRIVTKRITNMWCHLPSLVIRSSYDSLALICGFEGLCFCVFGLGLFQVSFMTENIIFGTKWAETSHL